MSVTYLSDSDFSPVFKRYYDKLQDNLYATYGAVWGQIRKRYNVGGNEGKGPIRTTFGGGVGSSSDGTLPRANNTSYLDPTYTWNRVYANLQIDGMTIEASRKSEHAFISAIDEGTTQKMKSFNRYVGGNVLFNDGTGALGQFSGSQAGTAAAPVVTLLTTGTYKYRKAYFEKGDMVNVNTLSSVWEITAVTHATPSITLARISGSDDLTAIGAGTHTIFMQNSKDNDPYGLKGIIDGSTHYGVAEEFRYSPTEVAAAGAPLETDHLNELVENLETDTDEEPDLLVFSPLQFKRYLSLLEDKKVIPVEMKRKPAKSDVGSEKAIAKVSYNGITYAGRHGSNIMCVKSKFVEDDRVYALNTKHIEAWHVGGKPGWKQNVDGLMFLRLDGQDAFGAYLRMYGEIIINPFYVGCITGLDT